MEMEYFLCVLFVAGSDVEYFRFVILFYYWIIVVLREKDGKIRKYWKLACEDYWVDLFSQSDSSLDIATLLIDQNRKFRFRRWKLHLAQMFFGYQQIILSGKVSFVTNWLTNKPLAGMKCWNFHRTDAYTSTGELFHQNWNSPFVIRREKWNSVATSSLVVAAFLTFISWEIIEFYCIKKVIFLAFNHNANIWFFHMKPQNDFNLFFL